MQLLQFKKHEYVMINIEIGRRVSLKLTSNCMKKCQEMAEE
jgi:hypothetical protein